MVAKRYPPANSSRSDRIAFMWSPRATAHEPRESSGRQEGEKRGSGLFPLRPAPPRQPHQPFPLPPLPLIGHEPQRLRLRVVEHDRRERPADRGGGPEMDAMLAQVGRV